MRRFKRHSNGDSNGSSIGGSNDGRTVVVTGSSGGIGRETARVFAASGANVVLHGRNQEKLEGVAQSIRALGVEVRLVVGDVANPATAERLRDAAGSLGGCDVLVNNAGMSMRGNFADTVPEVFDEVVRTNVVGAANVTCALIDRIADRRGSIVFVSSVSGLRGFPGISIYSAAKMALTGLAQAIRQETVHLGVHVGVVYLGYTENDADKRILSSDGSPMHQDRPHDMTQAAVAEAIARAVRRRRSTSILTRQGRLLSFADRVAPRLVDFVINRSGGRFHQMGREIARDGSASGSPSTRQSTR